MLSIKNWDEKFENNRTRGMKRMEWIPVSCSLDDDGYLQLIDHPDGTAHFGCWIAISAIAARCKVRGTLTRTDGETPHDASSLSRISRIPEPIMRAAIIRLSDDLKWIEDDHPFENIEVKMGAEIAHPSGTHPAGRARGTGRGTGREGKGREGKHPLTPAGGSAVVVDPLAFGFEDFWGLWPPVRKQAKSKAQENWKRHGCDAYGEIIREAVLRQKDSDQWQRGFIPMPTTWLNQKRWEDDPEAGNGIQTTGSRSHELCEPIVTREMLERICPSPSIEELAERMFAAGDIPDKEAYIEQAYRCINAD